MCGFFCIGFIGFMLKRKPLTEYTNLFSPNNLKKFDDIILNYFMSNVWSHHIVWSDHIVWIPLMFYFILFFFIFSIITNTMQNKVYQIYKVTDWEGDLSTTLSTTERSPFPLI